MGLSQTSNIDTYGPPIRYINQGGGFRKRTASCRMVVVSNILSKSSSLKPDEVMNLAEAEAALNHKLFVLLAKWVSRGGEQRSCPSSCMCYGTSKVRKDYHGFVEEFV